MSDASFEGKLNAASLNVGGDLVMRDARYADKVDMASRMSAAISICAAPAWPTSISRARRLPPSCGSGGEKSAAWKGKHGKPDVLNLRNAHGGNLLDAKEGAWPATGQLRLDGFTFAHLGGFEGDSEAANDASGKSRRGTIGRGSIPTTAQLPTLNSPPHSRTQATATPPMTSVISAASANARRRARKHGCGDPACCRPRSAPWPATALAPILSSFFLGCSCSGWPARRCSGGPFRRRSTREPFGASAPVWRSYCP